MAYIQDVWTRSHLVQEAKRRKDAAFFLALLAQVLIWRTVGIIHITKEYGVVGTILLAGRSALFALTVLPLGTEGTLAHHSSRRVVRHSLAAVVLASMLLYGHGVR